MSMVKDIAELLESKGIGTVGTDIFYGQIPEKPDDIIGVFEYAGRPPSTLEQLDYPGLQIRARGEDYESVRSTMQIIQNLLIRIGDADDDEYREGILLNDTLYFRMAPVQGPFPLGRDLKERMDFVQNYYVTKRR